MIDEGKNKKARDCGFPNLITKSNLSIYSQLAIDRSKISGLNYFLFKDLASLDLSRAALFLWIMPLRATLSRICEVSFTACFFLSWFFSARASLTAARTTVRYFLFLSRALSDCRCLFSADLFLPFTKFFSLNQLIKTRP